MTNKHLRVHVQSIQDSSVLLTLPNGATLEWPYTKDQSSQLVVGDELILTLTHSLEVVNELLGNT